MKIAIKPLKGEQFEVEVEDADTVRELKKKVAAAKAEFVAELQKLIYSGRVLNDDMVCKDVGIKDGEFLVVMLTKAKPAAPEAAAAPPAAPPAAPDTSAPMAIDQASAGGGNMGGEAQEGAIAQLCDMGFPREQVISCLRAAFNNPDRAVEYLMNGIPEGIMAEQAPSAPGGSPPGAGATPTAPTAGGAPPSAGATPFPSMMGAGGGGGGATGGGEMPAGIAALRNHPRFHELAQVVAANPQMINQILPALAQAQPGLMQEIQANPQAFMQLLQEATQGGGPDLDPVDTMMAAVQGGAGGGGPPPGTHVVQLTPDERGAVERLTQLGFDQQMALQAYLACDKNEDAAANFLFDSNMTDD
jgi:UV excision repair protein RAD23